MLNAKGFDTAARDAKLLAGYALGLDALQMASRENEQVSDADATLVVVLMQRRMNGESVARIIGEKEFYGLSFRLSPATLEPRPDTELLVDLALQHLPQGGRMLDLGTGTGCIPIAILANRPDASGLATDIDADALATARANARDNGVAERLGFAQGNWFEAVSGTIGGVDLLTSNPPYISSSVIETLSPEVKNFDPLLALDGGPDGLAPYRIIAAQAQRVLNHGAAVLVEIGYDQGPAVSDLFADHGFADIAIHKDLNGLDRVVRAHHVKDN